MEESELRSIAANGLISSDHLREASAYCRERFKKERDSRFLILAEILEEIWTGWEDGVFVPHVDRIDQLASAIDVWMPAILDAETIDSGIRQAEELRSRVREILS